MRDHLEYYVLDNDTTNDCIGLSILDKFFKTKKVDYNA